jgi:hypothetical protein
MFRIDVFDVDVMSKHEIEYKTNKDFGVKQIEITFKSLKEVRVRLK